MVDFSLNPQIVGLYDLTRIETNTKSSGKRIMSSMTPTIVEKDGKLFIDADLQGGSTFQRPSLR